MLVPAVNSARPRLSSNMSCDSKRENATPNGELRHSVASRLDAIRSRLQERDVRPWRLSRRIPAYAIARVRV